MNARLLTIAGAYLAFPAWLGCTALAGIHEGTPGVLADGGSNDGTLPEVGSTDASDAEAKAAAPFDAGGDTSPAVEAAAGPIACTFVRFSRVVVDDLSTRDSGPTTYAGAIGIVPLSNLAGTAVVVAQLEGDEQEFLGYMVQYGQTSTPPALVTPDLLTGYAPEGGIDLVATIADPNGFGNAALTTYRTAKTADGFEQGLQFVSLPSSSKDYLFAPESYPLADLGLFRTNSAALAQTSDASAAWIAAGTEAPVLKGAIRAGSGSADGGAPRWAEIASSGQDFYQLGNPQLFVVGGTLYAIVAGVAPQGAATVFQVSTDFPDASTQGLIAGPDAASVVFAAHPSVVDSSKVIVLAASQTGPGGTFETAGATVDPQRLASLVIGQSPFVQNPAVSPSDLPLYVASEAWSGDELFLFGAAGDKSGNAVLVWMGPDGHLVSASGPIVIPAGPIVASSIAAQDQFDETRADLVVAWVERITTGVGVEFDRLLSAQVTCEPAPAGGD